MEARNTTLQTTAQKIPQAAAAAVLVESAVVPDDVEKVVGPLWSFRDEKCTNVILDADTLATSGFQATQIGRAAAEIRKMLSWRPSAKEIEESEGSITEQSRCKIWLSFTSNMISSDLFALLGLRELFVFLVKEKMVDVIVTSAGGIEEDFIKCLAPTFLGDFAMRGKHLREQGWNRIGNLIVPNKNYCLFEDWLQPLLDECLLKQTKENVLWTPSKLIHFLGEKINDPSSLYYWCSKHDVPVFCPGITDGSLGDNLFFHSYRNPGLVVDVVADIRRINDIALHCARSGMVILGGGIAKHHTCNANLMRNGADFAVYVNTANDFDGCDSGARPDEAVSWGKIKTEAHPIKVNCDATVAFPLIAASSFCKIRRI